MYIDKQIWHTLVEVQNNWRQYSGRLMHMLSDMDKIGYRLVVRLALSTPVAQSCLTRGRMCMECDGLHCMSWNKNRIQTHAVPQLFWRSYGRNWWISSGKFCLYEGSWFWFIMSSIPIPNWHSTEIKIPMHSANASP